MIVTVMASSVWKDSQGSFTCNTLSPGCKNVCFNEYSPIALTTYWLLQLVFVSLPSIIFIVYTLHKMAKVDAVVAARKKIMKAKKEELKKIREKERKEEKQRMIEAGGDETKLQDTKKESDNEDDDKTEEKLVATKLSEEVPSKLFVAYFIVVLSRMLIEIGFMVGQYHIYTFKFVMPELFQCQHWPCPNVVECWVSRPKEKSIFICVFYATGCIMILLNILELYHIAGKFPKAWRDRHDDITKHANEGPSFGHHTTRAWAPGTHYIEESPNGYPDATGMPMIYEVGPRTGHRGRRYRSRRY